MRVVCYSHVAGGSFTTCYRLQVHNLNDHLVGEAILYEDEVSFYLSYFRNLSPRLYPSLMAQVLLLALDHLPSRLVTLQVQDLRTEGGDAIHLRSYYERLGFQADPRDPFSLSQERAQLSLPVGTRLYHLEWEEV